MGLGFYFFKWENLAEGEEFVLLDLFCSLKTIKMI